jgi:hypothetical protein
MPIFSDDFNRANGAIGSPWVTLSGTPLIQSNEVYNTAGGECAAVVEASVADVEVQATVGTAMDQYFAVLLRASDNDNYIMFQGELGSDVALYTKIATSFTQLQTHSAAWGSGSVFEIRGNGSTIQCFLDGVQIGTDETITFNQSVTLHGFKIYNATITLDDFSITAVSGGLVIPVFMNQYRQRVA